MFLCLDVVSPPPLNGEFNLSFNLGGGGDQLPIQHFLELIVPSPQWGLEQIRVCLDAISPSGRYLHLFGGPDGIE